MSLRQLIGPGVPILTATLQSGGGNRHNEQLQSGDIPLLWMRSQAVAAGLEMEPADVMWKLNKTVTNSISIQWWPLELFPFKHLLYHNSNTRTSRWGPETTFENHSDHQQASPRGSTQDRARTLAEGARVRAIQELLQALCSPHVLERCSESSAASETNELMGKGHLR